MNYKMTAEQVIALGPCGHDDEDNGVNYTPARVRQLFDAAGLTEASAVDILYLGPRLGIPYIDLLWLVLRPELVESAIAIQFTLLCAERVEANSEAAQICNATTRRFLAGEATLEELAEALMDAEAAALVAAWAADDAIDAIRAARAAIDAIRAARAAIDTIRTAQAAARAAIDAIRAAEAEWQCETLLSLLRGTSNDE